MTSLDSDSRAALRFLDAIFNKSATHDLVAIPPDGKPIAKSFLPSQREVEIDWINVRQGRENIYFSVNRLEDGFYDQKAKKDNIAAGRCLHVDIDDLGALERILAFEPKATTVVFSGGGYQAFWRLAEECSDLETVERHNAALARALGGDKCHNIDRIMRLPGTINMPNKKKRAAGRVPTPAYVVDSATDWGRRYRLSDFDGLAETFVLQVTTVSASQVVPVGLASLPDTVSVATRKLIEIGDDPNQPIHAREPHFKSRSEVVWRVVCDLARNGCSALQIAGVLVDPAHGISASILEKAAPASSAMRQAERALRAVGSDWPDVFKNGVPRSTFRNTVIALDRLELNFAFDMFRSRKSVQGRPIQEYQGDLSDDQCAVLRRVIIEKFNFDPGKENTRDAALTLAVENPFHPIRQYLDALHWDRTPRVDVWLTTYLGAEPTPLNKAIGRIVLLAGVRRIRRPGSKFDTIMVLEGPQGGGKSTAIKILAGPENFSDQELLTLDAKAQMEALEGVWILEIAELEGISRADTAKVKAFASRSDDNARPAYARFKEKRPRQTIFIGTTNDDKYLRDMTGNRRFWPVKIGQIDLEALARDRDQLWAEAAHLEAEGESLTLPQELWPAAQEEQEARLEDDPWLDKLSHLSTGLVEEVNGFQRISTAMLLGDVLSLPVERQQAFQTKRLANLMRKLGWQGPILQKMKNGQAHRGYQRQATQVDPLAGGQIDRNF